MPKTWSDKDERMYRHIRKSERAQGRSKEDADRIAAARVNDQRRRESRTNSGSTGGSGGGTPHSPLDERTKQQLLSRARELSVGGRSAMTKDQLISAIRARE